MFVSVFVLLRSNTPAFDVNPLFVKAASIISLLFCGGVLYFCVKILFLKRVGLVINDEGITDSSSALSLGFIKWQSIKEARVEKKDGRWLLLIYLKERAKYMKDENDYITRILQANIKNYDCEVVVVLGRLKCTAREVEMAIDEHNI
jgi:hypothetical protein